MADDGMIVNFAVEQPRTNNAQKYKGGSWRDRLKARQGTQHGLPRKDVRNPNSLPITKPAHARVNVTVSEEEFGDSRPVKRPRIADRPRTSTTRDGTHKHGGKREVNGSKDFVSSLFTSNPRAEEAVSNIDDKVEQDTAQPSNAPLIDGIDTFTSLGLSPTIAAHLLTKMELKDPTAIQKAAISQMLSEESDAFIQSETGSGKTLAYLLPLLQRIMTMADRQKLEGSVDGLHRDSGLFAVVLAPTRELCKQISIVLERLLGCAHYIVAGNVLGGESKKSEKARIRKGLNILVATPGRLVDHIDNTEVLDVSKVRWLILDEGDRLVELGFEQDIRKIVQTLDQRQRKSTVAGLPHRRTTVLCSATLKMDVQKLGEISLKDAALIRGAVSNEDTTAEGTTSSDSAFLAPAQLKQSYMVVPAKLRLVTLAALLRRTFARKGSVMKAIVFLSCADSVDFHFKVFTRSSTITATTNDTSSESSDEGTTTAPPPSTDSIAPSPVLSTTTPDLTLLKLHGSLPQPTRTSIVNTFSKSTTPSLLLATDVASRGLDLPNLDLVIEYDPAFSSDDHLHRIGRTARLGRDGRATIFLLPGKEEGYVEVLKSSYRKSADGVSNNVSRTDAEDVLKKGFSPQSGVVGSSKREYEDRATDFQLEVERWVLADEGNKDMARKAFQSHIRAYATHVAKERGCFDLADLHLGHLCKSFGLRDAPGNVNMRNAKGEKGGDGGRRRVVTSGRRDGDESQSKDAARRMRDVVRKQKMMGGGADEFNLA